MLTTFRFDPDRVAYLEAAGWRAYYDRDWPRVFRLIVTLNQEQFRIPFPVSLLAAYQVTRGAAAWAPLDHDWDKALGFYEKFYQLARRYSGLTFDPVRVAALEMQYNDFHRRLVGNPDKSEFVQTLIDLHSALFGLPPEAVRESAELRVLAANTVDLITGKISTDVEGDWARLENYLRDCYRSIQRALEARHPLVAARASTGEMPDEEAEASNAYHFISRWRVEGTVAEVSDVLGDAADLVRWWPAVYLDVRVIAPGDEQGVGKVVSLYTKGWLPYTLRWQFRTSEARPDGFGLEADGDFVGRGVWTFEQDGPWVNATYDWNIRAAKPLLRRLSFALKPIFAANHRWAMARGEESLRLELARRRAPTPEARAQVPAPPGPTLAAALVRPVVAAATAVVLALVLVKRLARR